MITVIDLSIGNTGSVLRALSHVGAEYHLTQKPDEILNATKLLLPGVGSFGAGMASIHKMGVAPAIREAVLGKKVPILGICMGMQLFASKGYEHGEHEGLGLLPGSEVRIFDSTKCPVIPHMGWNNLENIDGNAMLVGLQAKPDFYFVHSYHIVNLPKTTAPNVCEYGESFTASFADGNIFGAQFHPEKSQKNGLIFLKNYSNYA